MIQRNDDENSNENNINYQNLIYLDLDYDDSNDSKNTIEANYTAFDLICRRCQFSYLSNYLLHKYIRVKFFFKYLCNTAKKIQEIFIKTSIYNTVENNVDFKSIIRFNMNFNKNIEIDYDFEGWQYVIALINLHKNDKFDFSCIDTETDVTFANENYFRSKFKNIAIRIMTTFIMVRDLRTNKHTTNKYACCFLYFKKKTIVQCSSKSSKKFI